MKRIIASVLMSCLIIWLAALNKVEKITVSTDNPVVSRVAIALSQKATWTHSIDKDVHTVTVRIPDCDASSTLISGINNSKLVTKIDLHNKSNVGEIVLALNGPFFIETMSVDNPFKIVLDLFVYKKAYTYQELLYQAAFYEKSGFYAKAAKQYTQMLADFPQNKDTNYYLGNLLLKQKKTTQALEKLKAVPQTSKFYQTAQQSITKLNPKNEEVPIPVDNTPVRIDTTPVQSDTAKVDTSTVLVPVKPLTIVKEESRFSIFSFKTFFGKSWSEFLSSKFLVSLFTMPIWFWIIILVVIAIIILVIFDVIHVKRTRRKNRAPKNRKVKELDSVKMDMVTKLLENGWQEPEITRELLLSPKEAHQYITASKKFLARKKSEK